MPTPTDNIRLPMFSVANDTDHWAICVDGLAGVFESQAAAEAAYREITPPGCNHFDDTPFGACQLLPPGYIPRRRLKDPADRYLEDMTQARLSECQLIDIANYIRMAWARRNTRPHLHTPAKPAHERLAEDRQWRTLLFAA